MKRLAFELTVFLFCASFPPQTLVSVSMIFGVWGSPPPSPASALLQQLFPQNHVYRGRFSQIDHRNHSVSNFCCLTRASYLPTQPVFNLWPLMFHIAELPSASHFSAALPWPLFFPLLEPRLGVLPLKIHMSLISFPCLCFPTAYHKLTDHSLLHPLTSYLLCQLPSHIMVCHIWIRDFYPCWLQASVLSASEIWTFPATAQIYSWLK